MAMSTLKPPGNTSSRQMPAGQTNNFAKALLEAGGHAVQSTVDTGVQMAGDALASIFGAGSGAPLAQQQMDNGEFQQTPDNQQFSATQEQREAELHDHELRVLRHREIQQTEVYDRHKVETDRQIKQILAELEALVKDLDDADRSAREAQIAVMQGAVQPGEYHVTFFQKLLKVIVMLRQRVKESATWLSQFNSRKSAQKGYWGQFYTQGTQWSMSSERAIATSVG